MIEQEISHADKQVFLNVGIKLSIYFLENISRRWISNGLAAQDTATNRHDQRSRHAFAGNVCDGNAEPFVVEFDVIKVIAANLARWDVHPANFKSVHLRRFRRKKDALNVARDFQIVIEPLLFVRLGINDGVVKRERRLLGYRFENDKIVLREWRAHSA